MTQFSSLIYENSHSNQAFSSKMFHINHIPQTRPVLYCSGGVGMGLYHWILDPLEDIKNKSNPPEKLTC